MTDPDRLEVWVDRLLYGLCLVAAFAAVFVLIVYLHVKVAG